MLHVKRKYDDRVHTVPAERAEEQQGYLIAFDSEGKQSGRWPLEKVEEWWIEESKD